MDHESADRIGDAAERAPDSATATSGFDDRAQGAADRNDRVIIDDEDDFRAGRQPAATAPWPGR
ncbi:hypothetical protein ACH4GK_34065 [Streptomyces rimosus]|uniref:hypothetical protein n=1 Tax=Streptomyces rimosus TaxID=1927 RepID=UPI0004CAFE8A|nr:hypothetical protein [Streptomyces rimosus]